MKMTGMAILGITALAAFHAPPALCDCFSVVPPAAADSVTFALLSIRTRPEAKIRVYGTSAPGNPLMLRGRHLAPWGVREGLIRAPGRGATPSGRLRWAEIQRVEVMGSAARTGALIGAVAFGASWLALALRNSGPNGWEIEYDQYGGLLIYGAGTAASAFLGAAIGESVGSRVPKWSTAYRARG